MNNLTSFLNFYERLDIRSLDQLDAVYSEDITFVDPVTRHSGLSAIRDYFDRLLKNTRECRFDIQSAKVDGENGYISWCMSFKHPQLNRGAQIRVEGFSLVIFKNGKICQQRDYYDMGAMIYEHVPLLGGIVSHLRKRMAA